MNTIATPSALDQIHAACSELSKVRLAMKERTGELQEEALKVQRKYYRPLKQLADKAADLLATIRALIEANPELFKRPKTFTVAGIKVGYHSAQGSLDWDGDAQLVKAIRKHFGEDADQFLIIKEKPSAEGLESVDAKVLAKLGVRVIGAGDKPVIKVTDSDLEKLFASLIADAAAEEESKS